jgi:hypothetical protein
MEELGCLVFVAKNQKLNYYHSNNCVDFKLKTLNVEKENLLVVCDDYVTRTISIFTFRILWENYDNVRPRTGHLGPDGE